MPEPKRPIDHVARQNLMYVIEACARAQGKSKGGQSYLAALLGTRPHYLSAVIHGQNGRNLGREFKAKIEQLLKLEDGWMDIAHSSAVVLHLVSMVPPKPHHPEMSSREIAALRQEIRELRATVEALVARLDQKKPK